jgi:nitrogen fixation/metabolism regulation signal transduction histidine kinase
MEALNSLVDRLSSERQNIEVHSWEKLTRILTHEIMNSIAPITSLSSVFLRRKDVQESPIYNGIKAIHDTSTGLMEFVDSYRKYTTLQKPQPEDFSLREMMDGIQNLGLVPEDVTLYVKYDLEDDTVHADKTLIRQVIINIIKNAVESFNKIPEHPVAKHRERTIQVFAYHYPGTPLRIAISNNGAVIPPLVAADIFVPFFTTKKTGSGIGLSLCRKIMQMSGGTINLLAAGTNGWPTTFVLEFNSPKGRSDK